MKLEDALAQLARETARARRRLGVERALRAGLPAAAAAGVWALFALIGAHEALPFLIQSLSALAALIALAWLGLRGLRAWRAPSETEARARLAADSRLDAGAFEALRDTPTRYDAMSMALWRRERERALARAERVRAGPARPNLDQLDPHKLRFALAMLLVIGFVIAGDAAPDRLARAFLPDPGPLMGDRPLAVEAWAAPADYTHAPPVSLSDRLGERVETPPSIEVTVRVTGPAGAPRLVFDGAGGRRRERFERAADGAWEAHMRAPGVGKLSIVRFHTRAFWRLAPARDARPRAAFTAPIAALSDERVAAAWRASDDYGVRRVVLRVRPVDPPQGLARADPIDTELEAPSGDPREAQNETELDLAAHPYAGMEVEARIVAIDALGQEGASSAMRVRLPEKIFLQPLARAAIEIRRHILAERRPYRAPARTQSVFAAAGDILLGNQRIGVRDYQRNPPLARAPEGVRRAARLLDSLTMTPQDGYFRDLAVFLGLRYARAQLDVAENIDGADLAAETLWRTALRAEYGGAADARRALEEAQRQLSEALQQGAPQERIDQLLAALQRAVDDYMQALVQEAVRNGQRAQTEDTRERTEISGRDIEEMLRQVQRLSEQGRNAEAQRLLEMLAGVLANLDVQLEQAEGAGEAARENALQESMDELSEAMGEQRALNDDTRREQQQGSQQQQEQAQQQQGQQGETGEQREAQGGGGGDQQGGQGGGALAERQAQIRQSLAEAQRMSEEAGAGQNQDLDAAGEAMRQAENALRRGDLEGAQAAQAAALENLRDGAEALGRDLHARQRAQSGRSQGESGRARDPLGRAASGAGADEGQDAVPTQIDPARSREILDDILRRAQDPNRPEAEREYLRRLLDRFGDS